MAVLFFTACDTNNDIVGGNAVEDGNSIILDLSSSSLPLGRAVAATGAEVKVDHIDVLIFDVDGNKEYYERVGGSETGNGTIALKAKRNDFDENAKYWVYLIANSTADESVFADPDFDRTKLMGLTQEDRNIHMTGYPGTGVDAPEYFLMDGIAYPDAETEPAVAAAAPVVLYDGNESNDTKLKVTLRRAAAKIVVRINKGEFVEFNNASGTLAGYYLRNMPYTTSVVTGVGAEAALQTSRLTDNDYFKWTQDTEDGPYTLITVTAYTYAHKWENESALEKETRLIVNIPMYTILHDEQGNYIDEDGTIVTDPVRVSHSNSYYQIPVCRGKSLERNTYYEVSLTLNVPGGTDPMDPVKIEPTNYEVLDWDENTIINIGGESDRPEYLTLNENEFEMHNIDDDYTTLQFSSSSEVTATITKVYYIDKFGDEQELEKKYPDDPDSNEWGVKTTTGRYWPTTTWSNLCDIRITPDEGINGKIDVFGDVPENNAVRYIEFTVTNETGQERKVVVAQYPLEYITHVEGWYSYRSDFGGTNYENRGPNCYVSASSYDTRTQTWEYSTRTTGMFSSKYATKNSNNNSYALYYYAWDNNASSPTRGNSLDLDNPRMYHVQITASSGEYTLGKPRITDGKTDPGSDNAKLVSPSFMIASQLGAVVNTNFTSVEIAASHCGQYAETYKDENGATVHLNDWRLPTQAEVQIIMKFQNNSDAMDVVLGGAYYWAANGVVQTSTGNLVTNQRNAYLRCIRDAYNDK